MIRLSRPPKPRSLQRDAAEKTQSLSDLIESDWSAYSRRTKPKTFNVSDLYKRDDVKAALLEAQHDKCAYCELPRITAGQTGDVEHFRPKKACAQARGEPRIRPGYYWLAYAWENLLWACSMCNRAPGKVELFPVAHPDRRARRRGDDLDAEGALMIDPYREDPREHLGWRGPDVRGKTRRGTATIEVVRLDRVALIDARQDVLSEVEVWVDVLRALQRTAPDDAIIGRVRAVLAEAIGPAGPYAACVRAAFGPVLHDLGIKAP